MSKQLTPEELQALKDEYKRLVWEKIKAQPGSIFKE